MRKATFILAGLLALALPLVFASASAQAAGELDKIKQAGKIRVAVFSDKPPFGFVDENGVNQGYDIYLAHRLAQDLFGNPDAVEFVLIEAAARIEVVVADKADLVLANFTVTPERKEQVDFGLPYMKVAL